MSALICLHCGKEAADGARFCVLCGTQVSDPDADTLVVEEDESDVLLRNVRRELAGEYKIERELGRGGMAVVYEAVDVQLGRRVALKVLPPEMAMRKSMAERFKREAKMAAALDHPNIVPVYRVGQAGGLLYIAMKFISGRALDSILESQGPLQVPVVLLILRSAARALAYAHERGIVHRDVKSANIMIDTEGHAVVSDFGIARAVEEPTITATGTVVGTPYFMSPEQCAARRIGPQSDQYSLGVVAFQMLTGSVPFSADTLPGIMHHHFYTAVPDVRVARPEVPEALHDIINRMLSKKPEERYASTQALAVAIQEIPLAESDRRDAEHILRDVAAGAAAPRVAFDTLPPLHSSVRLTPAAGPSISGAFRHRLSRPVVALAGAFALAAVAGAGWWMAARGPESSPGETTSAMSELQAQTKNAVPAGALAGQENAVPPRPAAERRRDSVPVAARGGASRGAGTPRSDSQPRNTAPAILGASTALADTPAQAPAPPGGKIRVRVLTPATAEIWVDDRLLGTGVVIDAVLPPGMRRLRVVAQGFEPYATTFEVSSGETTTLPPITLVPRGDDR